MLALYGNNPALTTASLENEFRTYRIGHSHAIIASILGFRLQKIFSMTRHDTPATRMLDALSISYEVHLYDYDPAAGKLGIAAAAALGRSPDHVLKTLMVQTDGAVGCVVLPADRELDFAKVARAFGGRKAKMLTRPEAEARTGYKIGGVSPFGQRSAVPTLFEQTALDGADIVINGGERGLLVSLSPADALRATNGQGADLVRDLKD